MDNSGFTNSQHIPDKESEGLGSGNANYPPPLSSKAEKLG